MKQISLILVLALLAVSLSPVGAKDSGGRQQWSPYDFSFELPTGWIASPSPERLILGLPDDVEADSVGQTPAGTVIVVTVIEPPIESAEVAANHYDPFESNDPLAEADFIWQTFGENTWPALETPPIGERQGLIVIVAETFLVTASAPAADWATQRAALTTLIVSIQATPAATRPAADRLARWFEWGELRFKIPENWIPFTGTPQNIIVLESREAMSLFATTFNLHQLTLAICDLTPLHHLLTLETVFSMQVSYFYRPDRVRRGDITFSTIGEFDAASADFTWGDGWSGQAVALKSPGALYLLVGLSNSEDWEATGRDLFEAILTTIEQGG